MRRCPKMARKGKSERSRHERKRTQKPTILIAVEGETEDLYFGEVKRKFRAQWIKVENPKELIQGALSLRRAIKRGN